jgi:hypothetical protein
MFQIPISKIPMKSQVSNSKSARVLPWGFEI